MLYSVGKLDFYGECRVPANVGLGGGGIYRGSHGYVPIVPNVENGPDCRRRWKKGEGVPQTLF